MKSVSNKHDEFVESLRNIMKSKEKERTKPPKNSDREYEEEAQSPKDILKNNIDELFEPTDDGDD